MSFAPDPNVPDETQPPAEPPLQFVGRIEASHELMEPCPECGAVPVPIGYDADGLPIAVSPIHKPGCSHWVED